MKRVAALYDIHGNADALEAVLAEVLPMRPDLIVIGGDVAMGPFPAETLDRLLGLGPLARFLRGNADRELVDEPSDDAAGHPWAARARWGRERLGPRHRELLAALPTTLSLEVEGLGEVLFCHGTPRSDEEIVTRLTPESRLREVLAGVEADVVMCGHTHVQYDRQVAGLRLVNAGSVGMPYEAERGAYWARLGPGLELRRTAYDVERAGERIRGSGFPAADEFVSKTLLAPPSPEVASAHFEKMAGSRGA